MNKEEADKSVSDLRITDLQKNILRLAHERFLDQEDLSLGEILITLYGCRPARIGPVWVQNFSLGELLALCRSDQYDRFHFSTETEKDGYHLDEVSALEAVLNLAARGLVEEIKNPRIVWHTDKPLVKKIEYYTLVRLTGRGKKWLGEKREQPRRSVELPVECSPVESACAYSGLAVNISEDGLLVNLPEKFRLGGKVRVILRSKEGIEIFCRSVWCQPGSSGAGSYRCGLQITGISPEGIRKLGRLLAQLCPARRYPAAMAAWQFGSLAI